MRFSSTNGYLASKMWLTANLIQLFTLKFCRRYWSRDRDPGGRMFDQMIMAARSVTANIAEGLGRHQTSRETEMKLLDVARASILELYNDYLFIMLSDSLEMWHRGGTAAMKFDTLKVPTPDYVSDWPVEALEYVKRLSEQFAPWCEHANLSVAVNSIIALCERCRLMIEAKMNTLLDDFRTTGGFSEALTHERLEARRYNSASDGAPLCPECGKPMFRRITKRGAKQGSEFWGCSNYPACKGIIPIP